MKINKNNEMLKNHNLANLYHAQKSLIENLTIPNELFEIAINWTNLRVSPYSESYYSTRNKSWEKTPIGSYRISNHWNFGFKSQHCKTNILVDNNINWALAKWTGKVYKIILVVKSLSVNFPELRAI